MTRRWVVNASPLIVLGKLSKIELLIKLTDDLIVPDAVAQEIDRGEKHDPERQWLAQEGRELIKETPTPSTIVANWDLGDGESHVLSWASTHRDFEAILDDLAARRCAKTLSIPVRGTLGVLLLAKKHGLIPKLDPVLDDLAKTGIHIATNLLETIRHLADE